MPAVSFDVPGNITLRDVSRPAPEETPAQHLHRLAQKAVIEGVRILHEHGTGARFATSSSNAAIIYRLDLTLRQCSCPGFTRAGVCKHLALGLMQSGALRSEPVTCPECHGKRGERMATGGYLSESRPYWIWRLCDTCRGEGIV